MTGAPPYNRHTHQTAVTELTAAQLDRPDDESEIPAALVGLVPTSEPTQRAVESMAPENVGSQRERYDTVTVRCRLAAVAARSAHRKTAWQEGTTS